MSIICPNMKNPEVAREFNELILAIGEKGAYQVWSLNNGYGIDKAPNGEPSVLFLSLLDGLGGNRSEAIKAKAKCYGNGFRLWFGDWTLEDKTNVSKVVDENGEPLIVYHGGRMPTVFDTSGKQSGGAGIQKGIKGSYFITTREQAKRYADIAEYKLGDALFELSQQLRLEVENGEITEEEADRTWNKNQIGVTSYFLNIKNPIVDEYEYDVVDSKTDKDGHMFKKESREALHTSSVVPDNFDGQNIIIRHPEYQSFAYPINDYKTYKQADEIEWVATNPNQIKSATGNNGDFSTTEDNTYKNIINVHPTISDNTITVGKNVPIDSLTNKLNGKLNKVLKILISLAKKFDIKFKFEQPIDGKTAGFYDPNTKTVTLYLDWHHPDFKHTLFHEITHAVFEGILNSSDQKLTKTLQQAKKKLLELYDLYKSDSALSSEYAFTDIHEFLSELLSNSDFVYKIKYYHKPLWYKILEIFKLLSDRFGFNKNIDSIVTGLLDSNIYNVTFSGSIDDYNVDEVRSAITTNVASYRYGSSNSFEFDKKSGNGYIIYGDYMYSFTYNRSGYIEVHDKVLSDSQEAAGIKQALSGYKLLSGSFDEQEDYYALEKAISEVVDKEQSEVQHTIRGEFENWCKDNDRDVSDITTKYEFYRDLLNRSVVGIKANLSKYFGLDLDENGNCIAIGSELDIMRANFVNTLLGKFYNRDTARAAVSVIKNLIYNTEYSGELLVRSILNMYINSFQDSLIVQNALEKLGGANEANKSRLVDMMLEDVKKSKSRWLDKFKIDFKQLYYKVRGFGLTNKNQVKAIVKELIRASAANDQLDVNAEDVANRLRKNKVDLDVNKKTPQSVINSIIRFTETKIEALKAVGEVDEIKRLKVFLQEIKALDLNSGDVEFRQQLLSFLDNGYKEVVWSLNWLNDNKKDLDELDAKTLWRIKTDIIGAYDNILRNGISMYVGESKSDPNFAEGSAIKNTINELYRQINDAKTTFDAVQNAYVEHKLDWFIDTHLGIGAYQPTGRYDEDGNPITMKDEFKMNVHLLLSNQIDVGTISDMLDSTVMYGNASKNTIVRIVNQFMREIDSDVRIKANKKGAFLKRMYKSTFSTLLRHAYTDPLIQLISQNTDGSYNGNFVAKVNVGQYEHDMAMASRLTYLQNVSPFVKQLLKLSEVGGISSYQRADGTYDISIDSPSADDILTSLFKNSDYSQVLLKYIGNGTFVDLIKSGKFNTKYDKRYESIDTESVIVKHLYDNFMDKWQDGKKHRRFTSDYYITKRQFLSYDTMELYDAINNQILAIHDLYRDEETGVVLTAKIPDDVKQQLNKLKKQRLLMSSIYNIEFDAAGRIVSLHKKTGDDLRMANELIAWNNAKREHIKYHATEESRNRFLEVSDAIKAKYGEDSEIYKQFIYDNTNRAIDFDAYLDELSEIIELTDQDPERAKIVAKRNQILKHIKEKPFGYYVLDLSKLSDSAFEELRNIDEELSAYDALHPILKQQTSLNNDEDENEPLSTSKLVMYDQDTSYYEHLQKQYIDSGKFDQFREKYHYVQYTVSNGRLTPVGLAPLSVFSYKEYADRFIIENVLGIQFLDVDLESDWVDAKYQQDDEFDNIDLTEYADPKYEEIENDPKLKKMYNALIDTMDEAWSMLPSNKKHYRYMMPQVVASRFERMSRKKSDLPNISSAEEIEEEKIAKDNDIYEEFATRPDGTLVETVPLRWIKPMRSYSGNIDTDLVKTVTMFYKMCCNYKYKKEGMPLFETIEDAVRGGFSASETGVGNQTAADRIATDLTAYGYGRTAKGFLPSSKKLTNFEKWFVKQSQNLMSLVHGVFMINNIKSWLKNAADSYQSMKVFIGAGKQFRFGDFLHGVKFMALHPEMVRQMIIYNGAHEDVAYTYGNTDKWFVRRMWDQFSTMGPFTAIDYTFKALTTAMTYHHHRLVMDPSTHQYRYMNRQEAGFVYTGYDGMKILDGYDAWSKAEPLVNAYTLDENGALLIKPEYYDLIKPIQISNYEERKAKRIASLEQQLGGKYTPGSNDELSKEIDQKLREWEDSNRSSSIETRVAGYISERAAVINGMFTNYSKNNLTMTIFGAQAFMMRGWALTQLIDHLKDGDDFQQFSLDDDLESIGRKRKSISLKRTKQNVNDFNRRQFRGLYNFSTGQLDRGDWQDGFQMRFFNMLYYMVSNQGRRDYKNAKNKLLFIKQRYLMHELNNEYKMTEHEKFSYKMSLLQLATVLLNILLSFPLGWWDEDLEKDIRDKSGRVDKKKMEKEKGGHKFLRWLASSMHMANTGVQSERISQLGPVGFIATFIEFVKAPFITSNYSDKFIESISAVGNLFDLAYEYAYSAVTGDKTELDAKVKEMNDVVKSGNYQYVTKWQKAALQSTLMPYINKLGINNIFKSQHIPSMLTSDQFYYNATPGWFKGYYPNYTGRREQKGAIVNMIGSVMPKNPIRQAMFGSDDTVTPLRQPSKKTSSKANKKSSRSIRSVRRSRRNSH